MRPAAWANDLVCNDDLQEGRESTVDGLQDGRRLTDSEIRGLDDRRMRRCEGTNLHEHVLYTRRPGRPSDSDKQTNRQEKTEQQVARLMIPNSHIVTIP